MPQPSETILNLTLPRTGEAVATPPLDTNRNSYQIVLRGSFSIYGETIDAATPVPNGSGETYLTWEPFTPKLLGKAENATDGYQFHVAPGEVPSGQSLSVRLDISRLVDRYIGKTPSEIKADLTGGISLTVVRTPMVTPFPWVEAVGASLVGAVGLGGAIWVLRRRQLLAGLTPDLLDRIDRIQAKARAARQAVAKQAGTLPLRERIDTLAGAAIPLARQVADLRRARTVTDRATLLRAVSLIEERLPEMEPDSPSRREAEATLTEKRKALTHWDALERTESLCLLRLEKIESVLDATTLALHAAQAQSSGPASEEHLRKALDAEVSAIYAVAQDAPEVQLVIGRRS